MIQFIKNYYFEKIRGLYNTANTIESLNSEEKELLENATEKEYFTKKKNWKIYYSCAQLL